MTEKLQIYRCEICGNMVEVIHAGKGKLFCCGQPMKLLEEKAEDRGWEKHAPLLEKTAERIKVKIGSIPHPMEEGHHIEWIELISRDDAHRHFLKPGDKPEAEFAVKAEEIHARAYCNLHGLWRSTK